MKKAGTILMLGILMLALANCGKVRRNPGRTYMPDMAYSRAYETYASTQHLRDKGIYYDGTPVAGTIARGDLPAYALKNDSAGYNASGAVVNPLPALNAKDYLEAARLYLVNCAICHGEKLDGKGPLWKDGAGPFTAAPRNLMEPLMKALPQGTMFHVMTYGRNQMGSYASQLTTRQRWMIAHYIKEKQGAATGSTTVADSTANKDTAATTR